MSPAQKRHRKEKCAHKHVPDIASSKPAERFEAFRREQALQSSARAAFAQTLRFTPDSFQWEGMEGVENGDSVLVAAPTGAGKTVVGEFGTYLALQHHMRAFYTTPIKALSNQKFLDLRRRFGEDAVGLLTGDTSINAHASIVVMTTEVLRNMIYAGGDLSDLDVVILDEVHYLADRFRGPVWEEIMIHLPQHVGVIALSATVSNAEEFGAWMREVRGTCRIVVSEKRPVPLYQHMIAQGHLYDLYSPSRSGKRHLNPQLVAAVQGRSPHPIRPNVGKRIPTLRRRLESRPQVLITLDRAHLLPAIVFIFSRQGCEDAVKAVMASGVTLTSKQEAMRIRTSVDQAISTIPAQDHAVLRLDQWASAMERGIAAHHAGLLPVMKETVEHLFAAGLVKVVYATETLALGINMPARTVVIESLTKWNGVAHVQLSAGEFTQLSGRAGRRGIDTEGHAVVLHQGRIEPEEVAALASKRTYPLISAFHPTYNMAVNLLSYQTREQCRDVLETSFAQFQADGAVVGLAQRAKEQRMRVDELATSVQCEQGDALEYFALREELALAQKEAAKGRARQTRADAVRALGSVHVGDVIAYRRKRKVEYALVVAASRSYPPSPIHVVGTDHHLHMLTADDVAGGLQVVGRMKVDEGGSWRRGKVRQNLSEQLRECVRRGKLASFHAPAAFEEAGLEAVERRIKAHPVHHCPNREMHAQAGHAWAREHKQLEQLIERIDGRTNSVAKSFDRVCQVLEELDFIQGDTVTPTGEQLRHVFGERDLVIMKAIRDGAWDGLRPAELAAVASTCVFEPRGENTSELDLPGGEDTPVGRAWRMTLAAQDVVTRTERQAGAELTPQIDPGLLSSIHAWALGASLSTALYMADLSGGDFVRWVRQVMDLLDQLSHLTAYPMLAANAKQARDLLAHGVVAWSEL